MGVVFRALDPLIGRTVALKAFQISFPIGADEVEGFRKRFLLEGQISGQLKHPNIVVVHDVGVGGEDSVPYIAMELVEGTNLEDEMVKGRPPSLDRSLEIVSQLASALGYAHGFGVVHRDIKPANVLITTDGVPKIVDFGVARISRVKLTGEAKVFGSPAYMSPEQIVGEEVDGRSDLFALGILLYILVTGQHPFPGDDIASVAYKVLYQDPPAPSTTRRAGEVGSLDGVVMKALKKKRDERYQRGSEMAQAIDALRAEIAGRTKAAPVTTGPSPAAPAVSPSSSSASRALRKPMRWQAYALGALIVTSWTIAGIAGSELVMTRALDRGPDLPPPFQRPEDAAPLHSLSMSPVLPSPLDGADLLLADLLREDEESTTSASPTEPVAETPRPRPAAGRPALPPPVPEPVTEPAPPLENTASAPIDAAQTPVGILAPSVVAIDFDHHLSSGTLQVFVDGIRVIEEPLAAKLKRTLGFIATHNERLRSGISLAAGSHRIGVRVFSPELKIDEAKELYVSVIQGDSRTLKIRYGRVFGGLSVEVRD